MSFIFPFAPSFCFSLLKVSLNGAAEREVQAQTRTHMHTACICGRVTLNLVAYARAFWPLWFNGFNALQCLPRRLISAAIRSQNAK